MRISVFSRSFWRTYWISIRRSSRDSRDLKAASLITLGLLLFVGYYGTLLWNFLQFRDDRLILAPVVAAAIGIGIVRWVITRRDLKVAAQADEQATNQTVRARLAEDAYLVAVLLARAGSEQSLKQKELPQGVSVITPRVQIEKLRQLGKWDLLPEAVRHLLLLPDGHWTAENLISIQKCFEILRCLRWVLTVDSELTPLTLVPQLNYKASQEISEAPEKILTGKRLLPTWDIRVERNRADEFFGCCFAEAIGRGLIAAENPDTQKWALEVNETMRELHGRDMLAGIQTIGELENSELRYLTWLSYSRHQCLNAVIDVQDGLENWDQWQELCYPQLVSPTESNS